MSQGKEMIFFNILWRPLATGTLIVLGACGGGGGSEPMQDPMGQLRLGLTDGPVETAAKVMIQFTGVELKHSGEGEPRQTVTFDAAACDDFDSATGACTIDLLTLTGAERKVVFNQRLPVGTYEWVRLTVNAERNVMDSYIEFDDGTQCPLYIPSGAETGLKIVSGITVTTNGVSDYTLDFDVRKSVTAPPGLGNGPAACSQNYVLKPAIRIVDTTEVGTLAGTVDAGLLAECTANESTGEYENVAVYVFENFDGMAEADDLDGEGDPIASASVAYNSGPDTYEYEVGFLLAPEDYLLALTCTSDLDDPETNDFPVEPPAEGEEPSTDPVFSFIGDPVEVTTIIGQSVAGDFEAPAAP